jgi:phosphoglycerate kinase
VAKLTVDRVDLSGRRVFLRVDFNVPLDGGRVTDDTRITSALPTIEHCLKSGASLVLASHLGRPKGKPESKYSLKPVAARLEELLGRPVPLATDCVGAAVKEQAHSLQAGHVLMLENLRFHAEEEANDDAFALDLAALADVYVNDAFAAAHRAHASIEAIARHMKPAAAGLLMARELSALGRILGGAEHPVWAILGGAKVSDKLALVENLLSRVDGLLIGGGMAFTFLASLGHAIGRSLVEPDRIDMARRVLERARSRGVPLRLPVDVVVAAGVDDPSGLRTVSVRDIPADRAGFDIGPATVTQFGASLSGAKTVVWNGPMGVFELDAFAGGTIGVAKAVAAVHGTTIIGGGDSVAAVSRAGVADKMTHISTGGGASLEFLGGRTLPGVKALE